MKNPKTILIAIGGLGGVLTLVFGALIWLGSSDRAEKAEDLDAAVSQADRLTRLPVRPWSAAIADVKSNATLYANWRTEAKAAIAHGDRAFDPVTPPAFKTFLVSEARRLSDLPGTAAGKLVKPDFAFGFKDYITGGVLPKTGDLPRLQREWADITTVVELLATNGVGQITDVRLAAAAPAEEDEPSAKKRAKKKAKAKAGAAEAFKPDITRFDVDFLARPAALVSVVNGAAATARYVVIENFKFAPERDVIVESLGGVDDKTATASSGSSGSRRSRRRAAESAQKAKEADAAKKSGVIVDPAAPNPLKVTMTFAVYDFKSAREKAADEGKESK